MSFSSDVKEELSKQEPAARHCQIAEIAAFLSFAGKAVMRPEGLSIEMLTENEFVARKYFTLLKKAFNIDTYVSKNRSSFLSKVADEDSKKRLLQAVKLMDEHGKLKDFESPSDARLFASTCCRRAFLRGAFLAAGSITDPQKFYHLEIVCSNMACAEQIRDLVNTFTMEAKIVQRKKYSVVYLKEGNQIVDLLNVMEAHVALMNLENVRIVKEVRNQVNRQVNCEAANIHKTVSAAVLQIEDITYLRDRIGLANLPEGLEEIALARLERPEATLTELGASLCEPVGKSGVNHRLRKIKAIAESCREKEGGRL